MTLSEIYAVINSNDTNKYIAKHLDDITYGTIIEIMQNFDANDFKEINPNGKFEFTDVPIPYKSLEKRSESATEFNSEIVNKLSTLLVKINKHGTNLEYPFALRTNKNGEYGAIREFEVGKSQSCSYDWNWLEDYIKDTNSSFKLSILHTHPNPLGTMQETLFNKYSNELEKFGVLPNGLNISVADVYAQQYLEMIIDKYGKNISSESTILMHDGTLISFETKNGLQLTREERLELNNLKLYQSVKQFRNQHEDKIIEKDELTFTL